MRSALLVLALFPSALAAETMPAPIERNAAVVQVCEELHKSASSGGVSVKAQKEETARLEKLLADIKTSRELLRKETERLEKVTTLAAAAQTAAALPRPKPAAESRKPQLEGLAKTFSAMKPQKAAALLIALDPALATSVLQQMQAGPRSLLLEKVAPEKAAELIKQLAAVHEEQP